MADTLVAPHIVIRAGSFGPEAVIAGKGFKVKMLAALHRNLGYTPDEVVAEYDLTLAEVYAGLAHYYDHKDEIDALLDEEERVEQEYLRNRHPGLIDRMPGTRA